MGRVLKGVPFERLGLEITEHTSIPDYAQVNRVLRPLSKQGLGSSPVRNRRFPLAVALRQALWCIEPPWFRLPA